MSDKIGRAAILVLLLGFGLAARPGAAREIGPVRAGDSLWTLADRIATETGTSRDQVMLALLEANPGAFSPPATSTASSARGPDWWCLRPSASQKATGSNGSASSP